MSTITDLDAGILRPGYYLEIDGFPLVPYGQVAPTTASGHLPTNRTAAPGIVEVTAGRQSIDVRGGIVEHTDFAVQLVATTENGLGDLLRAGVDGADRYATLATTIAKNPAAGVSIFTNEDVSAWPVPGIAWIGQEACRYTSIVGTNELVVPAGSRGYYGSPVQEHVVNADEGWSPRIYSHCVTWEGRPARIRLVTVRPNRTFSPGYLTLVDGYIVGPPIEDADGLVEIAIRPWSGATERSIGGEEAQTGLQHGGHVLDGVTGHLVGANVYAGFKAGAAFSEKTDGTAIAAPSLVILNIAWRSHQGCFDPTQTDQRRGTVRIATEGATRFDPAAAGTYVGAPDNGTLTLAAPTTVAIPAGSLVRIENTQALHSYALELGTPGSVTFIEHPEATLEALAAAWQPGTVAGANGLFADIAVEVDHPDVGPALSVRMNTDKHKRTGTLLIVPPGRETLWYAVDLAHPDASRPQPIDQLSGRRGWWDDREVELRSRKTAVESDRDIIPIRGVALAYWQQERFIYVEDDVFSSAPFYIRALWNEDGVDKETRPLIIAKEAASVRFPGRPGVLLEVDDDDRWFRLPFGDWPGQGRVVIRELVAWDRQPPADILAQLLISGQGDGNNGTDDVLPYGCDIHEDFVNRASFSNFPTPPGVGSEWTMAITEERDVQELVGNLLTALNGALVDQLNPQTGERRIALVPMGAPVWVDAVAAIGADDWIADSKGEGLPSSELIGEIVNSITFNVGGEDSPVPPVTVNNRDSQNEFRRTEHEEIDLEGVVLPPASPVEHKAALLPVAADIFAARGYRRRLVRGLLPFVKIHRLDVGAVVTVSGVEIRNPKGVRNVTNATMRVLEIEPVPDEAYAEVGLVWYDAPTTGWAPSLRFVTDVSPTIIQVEANFYTEATHPVTGATQTDLDYFAVGDAIVMVPDGDWTNRVAATIVSFPAANQVEVSVAHGFVGGDAMSVDPADYATASAAHRAYAYLADDAGTLGAAPDDAYEYA